MKKSFIFIGLAVILVLAFILGTQKLKPSIEQNISHMISTYFNHNGLKLKEPPKVDFNLFSRTLNIDPFTANYVFDQNQMTVDFKASRLQFTFKGMLALSSMAEYVLKDGELITLYDIGECEGVEVKSAEGKFHLEKPRIEQFAIESSQIKPWLKGEIALNKINSKLAKLFFSKAKLEMLKSDALSVHLGESLFEEVTSKQIKSLKVQDIKALQDKTLILSIKDFSQKNIRLLSEKESLDLIQKLAANDPVEQSLTLTDLLLGDNSIVDATHFKEFKLVVDNEMVSIGGIDLTVDKGIKERNLGFKDIAIKRSSLENLSQSKLPIPEQIFLSLKFTRKPKGDLLKYFNFDLEVKDIFDLDIAIAAKAKTFKEILDKISEVKFQDLKITYQDQSLLARIGYYFSPKSSAKDFIASQLTTTPNDSEAEKDLTARLITFIAKPGKMLVTTPENQTFSANDLEKMSAEEFFKFFQVTFESGSEDIDAQVQKISQMGR